MIVPLKLFLVLGIIVWFSINNYVTAQTNFAGITWPIKRFSTEFYNVISKQIQNNENFICSPLSIYIALAMTSYGADGRSKEQLLSTLHLSNNDTGNARNFWYLMETLRNSKSAEVKLAGGLFLNANQLKVKNRFQRILHVFFNTTFRLMDSTHPKNAAKQINEWCEEQTNHRIKNIISPDNLNDALIIAINAVYFKGNWLTVFDSDLTESGVFYVNKSTTVEVPMMSMPNAWLNIHHLDDLNAKSIELKYFDGDWDVDNNPYSMFIIVPNNVDGLEKIGNYLGELNYLQMVRKKSVKFVNLWLPKFQFENKLDFVPILMRMGVTDIFERMTANFSLISDDINLGITKITQKAIIDVNEVGTVAAAANVAEFGSRINDDIEESINVNRPFFFAIVMRETGIPIFYGRVLNPSN